jgi:hypothetical protein
MTSSYSSRKKRKKNLSLSAPHILQVTVTLGEAVERVVSLATGTHKSAQSVDLVVAGVAAVLIDVANSQLDGGVVVGLDDAVGGRAFAGDVAVRKELVFL